MTGLPTTLLQAAERQCDLLSREQLIRGGVTPAAIRWGLARTWLSVLPGVIQLHRGPLDDAGRRVAALLYAGPHSVITGASAARFYGLTRVETHEQVRVLVPVTHRGRKVRWVRCERTSVDPQCWPAGAVRYAGAARAVIDTARAARGADAATAVIIEAVQRGIVPLDVLASTNDAMGRRGSLFATRGLLEAGRSAWSVPEAALARIAASCPDLPEMWCNPTLHDAAGRRLVTPDGWFDDVGLAVMVHSRAYHDGPGWVPTVERDGDLAAAGVLVLPLAPVTVERDPRRTAELLRRAHAAATARGGRPAVTAIRRTPW